MTKEGAAVLLQGRLDAGSFAFVNRLGRYAERCWQDNALFDSG